MPIHPQIQKYLTSQPVQSEDHIPSLEEIRLKSKEKIQASRKWPDVFSVEERTIDYIDRKIPIRIYTPDEKGAFPLFIYLHGGGFVTGDLDSHDVICRNIAMGSRHKVISVDYRLAPEHPFPAAVHDCYAAFEWVLQNTKEMNGDNSKITIGGDSAGGNLATVVCLMAKDRNNNAISKQVLFYPVIDYFSVLEKSLYASYKKYGQYGLSTLRMSEFWRYYTKNVIADKNNPYISPIRAESLADLPPAFIVTAELDILRDEGEEYAKRLEQDGVPVALKCVESVNHGYLRSFPDIEQSTRVFQAVSRFLNQSIEETVHRNNMK